MEKKRILFVNNKLCIGGVERALIALVNSLQKEFDVTVLLLEKESIDLIDELSSEVKIKFCKKSIAAYMRCDKNAKESLNVLQNIYKAFIRILNRIGLKKMYEKILSIKSDNEAYDCAISYTGYPGIWDAVTERTDARRKFVYIHNNPYALGLDKIDFAKYYSGFEKIICVSEDVQNKVKRIAPEVEEKLCVAYNLINRELIDKKAGEVCPYKSDQKKRIVTIARIENQSKRFDRIIDVVKKMISDGYQNFSWYIVGDGIDRRIIGKWIAEANLQDYIILEGFQNNPYTYMKYADLFVLTSDYEGLPVTLMEARYLKLPAVTTNFSCASEIIENNVTGFVCSTDISELATKIEDVLYNKNTREIIMTSLQNDKGILRGTFDYKCLM